MWVAGIIILWLHSYEEQMQKEAWVLQSILNQIEICKFRCLPTFSDTFPGDQVQKTLLAGL